MSREAQPGFAGHVFEQHGPAVRRYLRGLTGSASTAEDLAQEVFLRVVRSADAYETRERERAWVFRIARNVFLDSRRRPGTLPATAPGVTDRPAPATQAVSLALREGLDQLSPEDRDALLLAVLGGLTYEEIAHAMGSSVPAVRNRVYRARLALRQTLAPPAREFTGPRLRHDFDD